MKNYLSITLILLLCAFSSVTFAQKSVFKNFITASNGKLMDGNKEFRFISFNIPNLNYVEDELAYEEKFPYRMPDTYEMADALESINQLGGNVVRIYTIPVRNIKEENYPTYVLEPRKFEETSFKTMDTMLALANKMGVRIIIPIVNNWQWMGGRPQYADFRGKKEDDFWSDSLLIEDLKATIKFVVTRINTVTGVAYKDDKAIFCWETGNELYSTPSWTATITGYIKSLDKNHLIMDGYNAIDGKAIPEESFSIPTVDIVTTHHYEENPAQLIEHIKANVKQVNNRKPYIVGEFGFVGTPAIEEALNVIIKSNISGAMIWSLRHHRKEGGFYWHSEPLGLGIFKAYHWPGFASGIEYDETNLLKVMQQKGFEIQGKKVPPVVKPQKPNLLNITDPAHISWQGSVGASAYDIERSTSIKGPWQIVGYNVSDADAQYTSLFNDKNTEIGKKYFYRVIAKNSAGSSAASNIVGPVEVKQKCLIDNMQNYFTMFYKKGKLNIVTDNDRSYREIMYRMLGEEGAEMTYLVPGLFKSCKVYGFSEENAATLEFYASEDNVNFKKVDAKRNSLFAGKGDYGYWVPSVYSFEADSELKAKYVKIVFVKKSQVSRVENYYKD